MKTKIPIPALRQLLNELSMAEREALANACNTTVAYLWQLAGGHRRASIELALRLETHTAALPIKVTRRQMLPELFETDAA